jgi:hypothetical protein
MHLVIYQAEFGDIEGQTDEQKKCEYDKDSPDQNKSSTAKMLR